MLINLWVFDIVIMVVGLQVSLIILFSLQKEQGHKSTKLTTSKQWQNPFKAGEGRTALESVLHYARWIADQNHLLADLHCTHFTSRASYATAPTMSFATVTFFER